METTVEGSTPPPEDTDAIGSVPWSKCCVEGCDAKTGGEGEVILLPCLHAICSDQCSERFLEVARNNSEASGESESEGLLCNVCKSVVTREQLANKVNVNKEFPKKVITGRIPLILLCEYCSDDPPPKAIAFCPVCRSLLCDDCMKYLHAKARKNQDHLVQVEMDPTKLRRVAEANARNCRRHPDTRSPRYCVDCKEKLCQVCVGVHERSHRVIDIEKERSDLELKLNMIRGVVATCDTAVGDLTRKQEELKSDDLAQAKDALQKEFDRMLKILQKEAEDVVMKQVGALEDNKRLAESVKSSAIEFIKAGEAMLSDGMEFTAVSNFLRHSQTHRDSLFQKNARLTNQKFVDKDWHFRFKRSDDIQARAVLRNSFGRFDYPNHPQDNIVKEEVESGSDSESHIGSVDIPNTVPPTPGPSNQIRDNVTQQRRNKRARSSSTSSGSRRVSKSPASAASKAPRLERDRRTKRKPGRDIDEEVSADLIDETMRNYPEAPATIEVEALPPKNDWRLPDLIECFLDEKRRSEEGEEEPQNPHCFICMLIKPDEIAACCDFCPKIFHFDCHIPPVPREEAENDDEWRCNSCSEQMELPAGLQLDVKNCELSAGENGNDFRWASKFLMECYKIPESGAVRWEFPEGYRKRYGKLPYHLKYIRERLFSEDPEQRFKNVMEMMSAFEQMFTQALVFYKNDYQDGRKWNAHRHAVNGFKQFLKLVEDYYPQCLKEDRQLFQNVLKFGTNSPKSKAAAR